MGRRLEKMKNWRRDSDVLPFKTGFVAPSSRVFGRGELTDDPVAIMKRYLTSHFIIDILSIIPLSQVIVLAIPNLKMSDPLLVKDLLKYSVYAKALADLSTIPRSNENFWHID
ncbi:hypothetical protein JHK85_008784 [Glycine max]|nr:hypothetical protein JHK85_008784 [Glycine max]